MSVIVMSGSFLSEGATTVAGFDFGGPSSSGALSEKETGDFLSPSGCLRLIELVDEVQEDRVDWEVLTSLSGTTVKNSRFLQAEPYLKYAAIQAVVEAVLRRSSWSFQK